MYGRIRRWAVVGLLLVAGWAQAGEPPPFRETARVTLHQWVSQDGDWRHPYERVGAKRMAFTNNTWQAVIDGDWNNTSNWSLAVKPGGNHIAIFDGTSSISVTTNLDQSAAPFEQLLVKPSYGGNMGSQGNPLRIDLTTGVLVWRGTGQGFINPENGSFANIVCDVGNPFQGSRYNLVIGGMGTVIAGNVAQLGVKRGNVNLMADMNISAQTYLLGDAARLVMDATPVGMTGPQHVICAAGTLINNRPLAGLAFLIVGDRSRVTQTGALDDGANLNHVVVIGNGKFQYLPTSAPGTSPLLSVIGGVYDQSDEKWDNVWGTTIFGPDASIIGGATRGTNLFPASLDFRDEYPGAKE